MEKPENGVIPFKIRLGGVSLQALVYLAQLVSFFNALRKRAIGDGARMGEFQVVFALAASPFLAQGLAVMVLDNVGSDDLDEAKDGIFIVALNLAQRPKVVAAELEIGLLHKIIHQGGVRLSPPPKGFDDHA